MSRRAGRPEDRGPTQARSDVAETLHGWLSVWALAEGAVLTHLVDDELELEVLAGEGDLDLRVRSRYRGGPAPLPCVTMTELAGPPGRGCRVLGLARPVS